MIESALVSYLRDSGRGVDKDAAGALLDEAITITSLADNRRCQAFYPGCGSPKVLITTASAAS